MVMILHRKADSHQEGLQYKLFAVAASNAVKGNSKGSGSRSHQVASCLGIMESAGLSMQSSFRRALATIR